MSDQWKQIATRQANRCVSELFEAHRGVYLLYRPNVFVVFGNDGHNSGTNDWPRQEAEIVRQSIENHPDLTLLAFGLDDGTADCEPGEEPGEPGYTWVCVLRSKNPDEIGLEELDGLVWNAFQKAIGEGDGPEETGFSRLQSSIAQRVLDEMNEGEIPPSLN